MATKTIVKFNAKRWANAVRKIIADEQTNRLVEYAKEEIKNIGHAFTAWDRTGNLLDSLCWAVYYDGQKGANYGFYRNATASEDSYLHEYSKQPLKQLVDGHSEAQKFLATYVPSMTKGWEIVFAVCAPYWGYWEAGHTNPPHSGRRVKFAVMAERYDHVKKALGSKRTTFSVYVPLY